MRRLILIFALVAPLWCANTTVTGTLVTPTGDRPNGSCTYRLALPVSNGVYREIGSPTQVAFTGGSLSVSLLPTDQMTPPGQAYSVTCGVPAQQVNGHAIASYSWGPNYWIVPTSLTPLDISVVELPYAISALPLPSDGQVLAWSTATSTYVPETIDTSLVGENGRLYFTTARARAALSGAGPISYGNTTGIIDCPTCLLNSGSYSDPTWLSLSVSGGRISGLGGAAVLNVGKTTTTVAAGDTSCVTTVTYSSTPTFDFSTCPQQKIVLTGNASPIIAHPEKCEIPGGCTVTAVQDGTGGHALTWPAGVYGGFVIGALPSLRNSQIFSSYDGTNLVAITPGVINQ